MSLFKQNAFLLKPDDCHSPIAVLICSAVYLIAFLHKATACLHHTKDVVGRVLTSLLPKFVQFECSF